MKIRIEVEQTASVSIDITDEILDEIACEYNGNVNSWAKQNHHEYIDESDFDRENVSCYYDEEALKEHFAQTKKLAMNLNDTTHRRAEINNAKLRQSERDEPKEALKRVDVDVELMKKMQVFTGTNNPKASLNYISLNDGYARATNTHIAIEAAHKYLFKNSLFPTHFIAPLEYGAELYQDEENGRFFLFYNSTWHDGYMGQDNFPDFQKIFHRSDDKMANFKEATVEKVRIDDYTGADIKLTYKDGSKSTYIQGKYFNIVTAFDVKQVSIEETIYFEAEAFKIVVMPLLVDDKDLVEKWEE